MAEREIKFKHAGPSLAFLEKEMEDKLGVPRTWQLPDLEHAYDGLEEIGQGPEYFSHIRKGEYFLDLGGPKTGYTGYYFTDICDDPDEVVDGKVTLYGPDIHEILPESTVPLGLHWKLYGRDVSHLHAEYLGRQVMTACMTTEGWMISGAAFDPWIRLSKKAAPKYKGFYQFAQLLRAYGRTTSPLLEKVEMVIVVGAPVVGGVVESAPSGVPKEAITEISGKLRKRQEIYDAWSKEMQDADVEIFYGCTLCKMIAPNHACVVAPSNVPFCGFASWSGMKTTYEVEPGGYIFACPRGELIDKDMSWYKGVDEEIWERSNHKYHHFFLNSTILYPATNCGCFEAASFYIPEVDGIGIVNRRYTGETPLGIPFSTLAGFMSGGEQNHGFKGLSVRNMMMRDLLRGDGGWNRVVWMPKDLKLEVGDAIPEEVYEKIATEEDCLDPDELLSFLQEKKHPIVSKFWVDGEPQPVRLPRPSEPWPEEDLQREIQRVKRAKEL